MSRKSCLRAIPLAAGFALGCSAGGNSPSLLVGSQGAGGRPGGGNAGFGGNSIVLADAGASRALSAHVESPPGVTVEFVTLSCSKECADVVVVAKGGFTPYSFTWQDGSTDPARRVCPTATTKYEVSVTDKGSTSKEFPRVPQTVGAALTANVVSCPPEEGGTVQRDGGSPSVPDAGHASRCATGDPVRGDPIGGTVTYFRQGAVVPKGRYRVSYMDGCMRFGQAVGWTIQNQLPVSWFLVGDTAASNLGVLPGVTGLGSANFDDCVAASLQSAPLDVDFAGGKMGVVMVDYPLSDNIAGLDGRDPEWCLTPL